MLLVRVDEIFSLLGFRVLQSGASNRTSRQEQLEKFGEVMAETNCFECGCLHDTYDAATIRYLKFCESTFNTRDIQQSNQLFTEMNDAMLAFISHKRTHPQREAA